MHVITYQYAYGHVSICIWSRINMHVITYQYAYGHVSIAVLLQSSPEGGSVQQLLVERHDARHKLALADEVPGDDVEGAHLGARTLLPDPGQQRRVRGRHQVLQRLGGVGADVLQVLCQVDARHEETAWRVWGEDIR